MCDDHVVNLVELGVSTFLVIDDLWIAIDSILEIWNEGNEGNLTTWIRTTSCGDDEAFEFTGATALAVTGFLQDRRDAL